MKHLPKVAGDHKSVLITGCDSGFGYLTTLKLNSLGFYVFATCLNPDSEGAIRLPLECVNPRRLEIVPLDVTNESDIARVVKEVERKEKIGIKFFAYFVSSSRAVSENLHEVPNLIVHAVTAFEPDPVYNCTPFAYSVGLWAMQMMPWNVYYLLNQLQYLANRAVVALISGKRKDQSHLSGRLEKEGERVASGGGDGASAEARTLAQAGANTGAEVSVRESLQSKSPPPAKVWLSDSEDVVKGPGWRHSGTQSRVLLRVVTGEASQWAARRVTLVFPWIEEQCNCLLFLAFSCVLSRRFVCCDIRYRAKLAFLRCARVER